MPDLTRCSQPDCTNPAALKYTWPGRDQVACCVICAVGIANVARVIGLHLQFLPVTVEDLMTRRDG